MTDNQLRFPKDDLVRLFKSAQVDLHIDDGGPVEIWETADTSTLIDRWRPNNASTGHIVISGYSNQYPDIAGELIDRRSRGVAMVYSLTFLIEREQALLQTTAHEIGHMLNLPHENPPIKYTNAMAQAAFRNTKIDDAWTEARREAASEEKQHQDPCYDEPDSIPPCYPFSIYARRTLRDLSDKEFLPWGSEFSNSYPDGADDRTSSNH